MWTHSHPVDADSAMAGSEHQHPLQRGRTWETALREGGRTRRPHRGRDSVDRERPEEAEPPRWKAGQWWPGRGMERDCSWGQLPFAVTKTGQNWNESVAVQHCTYMY